MRGMGLPRLLLVAGPVKAGGRAAIALLVLPFGAAPAHENQTHWTYPPACCHGDAQRGECQRIPARTVHRRKGGWTVVLEPGDHRKVTRQHRYFIPDGDEIPSGDGDYHICLHPTEDDVNCFFAPPDST